MKVWKLYEILMSRLIIINNCISSLKVIHNFCEKKLLKQKNIS